VIHRVHIENMRVIKKAETTLEQLTVLVGANGSGKSTFMDAVGGMLSWANQPVRESCSNYFQQREKIVPPNFAGWLEFLQVEAERPCRLSVSRKNGQNAQPDTEWQFKDVKGNWSKERLAPHVSDGSPSELGKSAPKFVLPLRLVPEFLKAPSAKQTNINFFPSNGAGIAAYLANVKLEDDDQFEFLKEAVCAVVPTIKNVVLDSKSDQSNYKLEVVTLSGERVPAQHISDGTIYTIALITALSWTRGKPGLVLIDDIDHGLHPKAQQELIKQLRKLLKRMPEVQIIATAHSPYMLDHVEPEEIRCLTVDPELGTKIAKLTDHEDFEKWKDEMKPGEFWSAVGEGWVPKATAGAE